LKGDNDTEYFHRCANGRRRKQTIFFLKDDENNVSSTENLLKHATNYYRDLFGSGTGDSFQLDQELWLEEEQVFASENETLTREFAQEEIKYALYQMERNKATRMVFLLIFLSMLALYET
jgi:hypothetical protein